MFGIYLFFCKKMNFSAYNPSVKSSAFATSLVRGRLFIWPHLTRGLSAALPLTGGEKSFPTLFTFYFDFTRTGFPSLHFI